MDETELLTRPALDTYRRIMSEVSYLRRHVGARPLKARPEGWSYQAYQSGSLERYLNWLVQAELKQIESWPPDFETAVGFV